ncbi:MAG: energy-coupling factor transporter transmembrane protein EcfT [Clostridium sp.]|nr:energy-coupling factor transporter transmembrane protein EcfT [Clostridium sp.]
MSENQRLLMRLHPVTILCYLAAASGIAMFCVNPVVQGISVIAAWILMRMLSVRIVWRRVPVLIFFLAAAALINPLFYHNGVTVLFYLNGNRITMEALRYGICTACMLCGVFLWCRSLSQLFSSDRILCLLGAVSPKAALVCSMTIRFLPMYVRQMEKTKAQQRILGLYRENTLIDRIRGSLKVFAAVTTWALEHSMHTADSMQARGYGARKRTQYRRWRFGWMDAALCSGVFLLLITIVIEMGRGSVSMRFYPVTDAIPLRVGSIITYVCYAAICLSLPAVLCVSRLRQGK